MIPLYWILVLANAAAFGTLAVGWWAVPVVALAGGAFAPRGSRPILSVPLGAAAGWGALLLRSARAEAFPRLTQLLTKVLPISPAALVVATIGLAVALALGAALVGAALRRSSPQP